MLVRETRDEKNRKVQVFEDNVVEDVPRAADGVQDDLEADDA